jgi:hypothetical protein
MRLNEIKIYFRKKIARYLGENQPLLGRYFSRNEATDTFSVSFAIFDFEHFIGNSIKLKNNEKT